MLILNVSAPVRRVARLKVDDEEERIALVATKAEWSVERRFMWERISDRSHESSRRECAGTRYQWRWVGNADIARQFSGFSAPERLERASELLVASERGNNETTLIPTAADQKLATRAQGTPGALRPH